MPTGSPSIETPFLGTLQCVKLTKLTKTRALLKFVQGQPLNWISTKLKPSSRPPTGLAIALLPFMFTIFYVDPGFCSLTRYEAPA